jgi:hypothetical protein
MQTLTHQRCFNHSEREAAARCTGCRQFFCRECVTEHDDRVLCSVCLQKLVKRPLTERGALVGAARLAQCFLSVLLLWFLFYVVGGWLASSPTTSHEGTFWKISPFEQK